MNRFWILDFRFWIEAGIRTKILGLFVGALLLALSLPAEAQQAAKVPRIGVLWPDSAPSSRIEEFRHGLKDLGYIEGRNIIVEYRYAQGKRDRLPDLTAELVRLKVDVIVALSTLAARPAKKVTNTIPIVTISGDPIGTGLVASLARPGGNVTGLTCFSPDLIGKRLEILKEVVSGLSRVAILWDADGPAKFLEFKEAERTAPTLYIQVQSLEVRAPNPDLDGAFGAASKGRVHGLVVLGNPLTSTLRGQIVERAAKNRLPSMFDAKEFPEAGGLMSYGPNLPDLFRRALHRQDFERREARGPAGRAADEV